MLSASEFSFLSKYETSHREDTRINSLIVTCQKLLWPLMKHQKMEFTKSSWIWLCKETLEFNINSHLESITNQETVFTLLNRLITDSSRLNSILWRRWRPWTSKIHFKGPYQSGKSVIPINLKRYLWRKIFKLSWSSEIFEKWFSNCKSHIVPRWWTHNNDWSSELWLERCF